MSDIYIYIVHIYLINGALLWNLIGDNLHCSFGRFSSWRQAHRKAEAAKKALSFRPVWLTLEFSRLPSMASAFHGGESCHARSENSAENEAEAESAIQLSRSLEAVREMCVYMA